MKGEASSHDRMAWALAIAIWLVGAMALAVLWQWHPRSQVLDIAMGFVLYVAAFFYFLALMPIRAWVARRLTRRVR